MLPASAVIVTVPPAAWRAALTAILPGVKVKPPEVPLVSSAVRVTLPVREATAPLIVKLPGPVNLFPPDALVAALSLAIITIGPLIAIPPATVTVLPACKVSVLPDKEV